jgi:long-chain acyl-CoA synthetase
MTLFSNRKNFLDIRKDQSNKYLDFTIPQLLAFKAAEFAEKQAAIREKAYGIWETFSWNNYLDYVKSVGLGLISVGLHRGEVVGIIMDNHAEWLFAEVGIQAVGGISLNLFTSALAGEICEALNKVEAAAVFVENQEQADKVLAFRDKLKHVKKVIYVDPTLMHTYNADPWFISFRDLIALGKTGGLEQPERFQKELKKGRADETALMIQTSGTTGIPKIAMLSHRNVVAMGEKWKAAVGIKPGENWISMSPPAWIVDQMWGLGVALCSGMTMNFPEMADTVDEDFREIGPSRIITASRFWEDMASKIRVRMMDASFVKRRFFNLAERIGRRVEAFRIQKKNIPVAFKFLYWLASLTVYRPLLDRIGCANFSGAYTGGHPISPDVIKFFRAFGMNLKQCYGLTEGGGIFQLQPDGEVKPETVGKPLLGVEIKIDKNQEVLVKSDSVFQGYYKNTEATQAAFAGGWLRTGDAGYLDHDGHLLIIGRKEEVIRTKTGKAFSPDFIETRLKFSPFIKEAVIFGEGRSFLTALINIDFGNTGSWAEKRMIPYTTYIDLSRQPAVQELILSEVRDVNLQLPEAMKIHKFVLLYKMLDADEEELTRTGKVRRHSIHQLYSHLIEGMYRNEREIHVNGTIRYRDGQTGAIDTRVLVIDAL